MVNVWLHNLENKYTYRELKMHATLVTWCITGCTIQYASQDRQADSLMDGEKNHCKSQIGQLKLLSIKQWTNGPTLCHIVWLPYAPEYVDKPLREAHGFVNL